MTEPMSSRRVDDIRTLDQLRDFVHQTLCAKENLLPDQFRLSESQLRRQGEHCGIQFILRGPRAIRLEAIWSPDRNAIYFYDARGVRFRKLELPHQVGVEAEPAQNEAAHPVG